MFKSLKVLIMKYGKLWLNYNKFLIMNNFTLFITNIYLLFMCFKNSFTILNTRHDKDCFSSIIHYKFLEQILLIPEHIFYCLLLRFYVASAGLILVLINWSYFEFTAHFRQFVFWNFGIIILRWSPLYLLYTYFIPT